MEEQALTEEYILLNRQINFLVMREMWRVIRKRLKKTGESEKDIYTALRITRTRYTRAIDGEPIRFSDSELYQLMKTTGLRREIFEGKDCFKFSKITRRDWRELFELRRVNITKFKLKEKELYQQKMSTNDFVESNDKDLHRFKVYLETGTAMSDISTEMQLNNMMTEIKGIRFEQLEECETAILQKYLKTLKSHMQSVNTLVAYRSIKHK